MKGRGSKLFSSHDTFETNVAKSKQNPSKHVYGTNVEKHSTARGTNAGSKIGKANQEEKETNI
jgi:hypothetical protein